MTQGEHEAVDQHGQRADDLAPELVDAATVEQAVDPAGAALGGEEADGDGAPEAADEVHADHVERVVDVELVLQPDGQGAQRTGDGAEEDRADRAHRGARRGDGDEAGDDAGGGAERGGVAVADALGDQPGEARRRRSRPRC